jgi:hypothetical protein
MAAGEKERAKKETKWQRFHWHRLLLSLWAGASLRSADLLAHNTTLCSGDMISSLRPIILTEWNVITDPITTIFSQKCISAEATMADFTHLHRPFSHEFR